MILEGIVTTMSPEGLVNVAPMGPRVEADWRRFVLRPFTSSTTYRNLKAHGEGVLHVTDDALLLAQTAIGHAVDPPMRPADAVRGRVLLGACRYYEFRVVEIDDTEPRTTIAAEVVASGRLRDFFGWNRAQHAVVEAAILATRTDFLPLPEILADLRKLAVLVQKTGGTAEHAAFKLLVEHVRSVARLRGIDPEVVTP
ncbi:MAG TPA: DUF447 domain-containing protein [Isosphaeraceae bacterium]|jgi:hypothetical protein|nr:DUF447 domain-containing protein [Isosphaeraceae bacterium]